MNIYIISVFASLIVYFSIGSLVGRKVKNIDDFFVSGRNAPSFLIIGTLVASYLSTGLFLGETGFAYDGFPYLMLALSLISVNGCYLGAMFFGRYLRRSQALTIPEFFGKRFDSPRVQKISGITTIAGITLYLLGVTQGTSVMLAELSDIPYWMALVIIWFAFTSFTFYSGSKGVLLTDTLMFVIFAFAGVLGSVYVISSLGGWSGVLEGLATISDKAGIVTWHGYNTGDSFLNGNWQSAFWLITLGLVWASVLAVSPWQSGRYLMAKNEHVVVRSGMLASLCLALIYMLLMTTGAALNLINDSIQPSERAMVWAALEAFPIFLGVLTLSGIFAAGLSSCSTFLSLVGFSLSNDVFGKNENRNKTLKYSRISILISGGLVLLVALVQPPAVMAIVWFSATLFASSWGPVGIMSIWSKRITADAAFWGIILGFVGNLIPAIMNKIGLITLPVYFDPVIIGAALSIISIIVLSRKSSPSASEKAYLEKLHASTSLANNTKENKVTIGISALMIAAGVAISTFMLINYASSLKGLESYEFVSDGDITGGYILSLLYGLPMIIGGTLGLLFIAKDKAKATRSLSV